MKNNKKGQIDFGVGILIVLILGLIIFAPIMLRIIGTITGTLFSQMNQTYPLAVNQGSVAVDRVVNFFDYLIVIAMFISVIVLFISAWFIDTNPAFIILYIMFSFILFLFLPSMLNAVDSVWFELNDMDHLDPWEKTTLDLNYTNFIRENIMVFSLLLIILTGVVIYAKFKIT